LATPSTDCANGLRIPAETTPTPNPSSQFNPDCHQEGPASTVREPGRGGNDINDRNCADTRPLNRLL
jgi:hypothetical protein